MRDGHPGSLARLRIGLSGAAALPGFGLSGDPLFDEGEAAWTVPVTLEIENSGEHVPASTEWVVLVDHSYPFGRIEFYPAASGGITATFPHQEPNLETGSRWRTGKLCLDKPYRLHLIANGDDPVGNSDSRLVWHARRALAWLTRAAVGDLVRDGEPFEIPRYPARRENIHFAHDESPSSRAAWTGRQKTWGFIKWWSSAIDHTLVAARFLDRAGRLVRPTAAPIDERKMIDSPLGVWWLWPEPLAIRPWQPPITWGDFRRAGKEQGIDIDGTLRQMAAAVRGRGPAILMVGYPIPLRRGGPAAEVHWQALDFGSLDRSKPRPGFRSNEIGWWQHDLATTFRGDNLLKYVATENWHTDRLQARGRFPMELCKSKVAVIGCGSLGSLLAEILARGGLQRLLLIDGDILETGNVVRHALTAQEVGKNKASMLALFLRTVSPLVDVEAYDQMLPATPEDVHDLLRDYDIVIDCTASAEVPAILANTWWSIPPLFVSASVGFEAKRTFLFRARDHRFPVDEFQSRLDPWVEREKIAWAAADERLEGPGCYSPVFPARIDDMMMAAVATCRFIAESTIASEFAPELRVLEQSGAGLVPAQLPAHEIHAAAAV